MNQETKQCQNCHKDFTIEPEDFNFYEKIKVPPPTFCPECRIIRRTIFLNFVNLYKKTEAKKREKVFSGYPEEADIKIYDHDYWWSDNWNPMDYGEDVDFSEPFLEQLKKLNFSVPWPSRSVRGLVNSDYCNCASYLKNCYLCFNCNDVENCQYCFGSNYAKDSIDCCLSLKPQLCYELFECNSLFQCFYCAETKDCRNLRFCDECINCSDCFGCFNLRNKQYYIWNQPHTKEDYFKKLKEINVGSYAEVNKIKEKFNKLKFELPRKYIHGNHNKNVTGEYVYRSKDTFNCFEVGGCENVRYSQQIEDTAKDSYDYTNWSQNSELVYEAISCGDNCQNIKFCFDCWPAMQDSEYCLCCHSCSNCFGCMGLRSKQYCVLNKQYTKEEYERLVPMIKKHMADMPYVDSRDLKYSYGEFFPIDFSPMAYNETMAMEYFPKTKEQVLTEGYFWRDKIQGEHKITLDAKELPDDIKDVSEDILKEVIRCESCKGAFKLIEAEVNFYRKFLIPLPRMCFWCRHMDRRKKANPLKLWHRQCMCDKQGHSHKGRCEIEFETSYAPDRPEIVYCEECYQKEVY
ncbi:MAG: hypothetical protein NTY04_03935 [Candidatus Staskawiczbacteria bacterium]|nr:hypothetical protein [Candidatus Staskawiczbacteria bacterium]